MGDEKVVKYKLVHPRAKAPTQTYSGEDVGWDLYACEEVVLKPGKISGVNCGVAFELPIEDGYVWEIEIRPRSGHRMFGILVTHGTIDAGYRGEVGCFVLNTRKEPWIVSIGEKICQAIFSRHPKVKMWEMTELSKSKRGGKGLASSGM